ncbi:MAG: hypothetical protein JO353_03310 [Phycisphaerae bacterium]|nr:hypothetical protein [Phycisphaerae bacterium]
MSTQSQPISNARVYPDWKAPAEDAGWILWPDAGEFLEQTRQNHARLRAADGVRIQNTPLNELRPATRAQLGHADDQILIATGHQTELHHPGVWAKNLLLSAAAPRLDARALHIAVDTDAPKHLTLRWPGEVRPQSEPLSDDPSVGEAAWSGLLPPPSEQWLQHLATKTQTDPSLRYAGGEPSLLPDFWPLMRSTSRTTASLDQALAGAMHALDRSLGLHYELAVASTLWDGSGFRSFAHHILARAREFAADYNGALASYRKQVGIRSTMHPMPDLFTGPGAVETPFWLDHLETGKRQRPSVFDDEHGFRLEVMDGESFWFDPDIDATTAAELFGAFLKRNSLRLSPRALTLTMFIRLLLADQFVHGIGGGRYDQVMDDIVQRHFRFDPPTFSVTTATLIFPGAAGRERVCIACLKGDGHRLKHAVLGHAKRPLVERIESLPRKSPVRAEAFAELHRQRHAALLASEPIRQWQAHFEHAQATQQREKTLFDRELFYVLQTRQRLEMLIDRYREAFE